MPNKFPAFGPWSGTSDRGGLFSRRAAVGRQEVVIHSPRHVRSLAELSARELDLVARAWRARAEAAREAGFAYVHCSINEGRAAGASLAHSHSQLVWLPETPPLVRQEQEVDRTACVVCSMIREEIGQRIRLVVERDGLVLLCPFASRQPYEMLVAPLECESDPYGPGLLESGLALVWDGVRRLRGAEGHVSYNAWLHSGGHWHIEIVPRIAIFAGLELGAGYYVNTLAPESAAGVLREA